MKWYSKKNLKKAWSYAKIDVRDDFIFDIINYEDIKMNIELVITSLHTKIRDDQYCPAPINRLFGENIFLQLWREKQYQ